MQHRPLVPRVTSTREGGRCVCSCPREQHDHYRKGADCGNCGKVTCPRFIPMSARGTAVLTVGQRLALAQSDARFYYNLWHLSDFALTRPPVPPRPVATQNFIPIPAQRRPSESMDWARARAIASQARPRGNKPKR